MYVFMLSSAQVGHLPVQTLTVFLGVILTKRYTNPSADIITVLAGLDDVDAVFFEFANAIEGIVRTGSSRETSPRPQNHFRKLIVCSRDPKESYRCRSIVDFGSLSDESGVVLYTSRLVSCFDEGTCYPYLCHRIRDNLHCPSPPRLVLIS